MSPSAERMGVPRREERPTHLFFPWSMKSTGGKRSEGGPRLAADCTCAEAFSPPAPPRTEGPGSSTLVSFSNSQSGLCSAKAGA